MVDNLALSDLATTDPSIFIAAILSVIGFIILLLIALYVYNALVYMTIAKKLGYDKPWLAWIPIVGLVLVPILAEKKWTWVFMFLVPIAGTVFGFIWHWRIYEKRNYPGWLCLISLAGLLSWIPFIGGIAGLSGIANLVILGLVAWKDR